MIPVIVESPYSGDVARNEAYLNACLADCLRRGESPYASHGLYTRPGVLDDTKPEERTLGIQAGFVWGRLAAKRVFYVDFGWSGGMRLGQEQAELLNQTTEIRNLPADLWASLGYFAPQPIEPPLHGG